MALITESEIRRRLRKEGLAKELILSKKDIVTPSAKSLLNDKKIVVIYEEEKQQQTEEALELPVKEIKVEQVEKKNKYHTLFGAELVDKPEYMTHLCGNTLVFKDHPRIAFRGSMDTLEASLLEVQFLAHKKGAEQMVIDLQDRKSVV